MRRGGLGEEVVGEVEEARDTVVGVVADRCKDDGDSRCDANSVLRVEVLMLYCIVVL